MWAAIQYELVCNNDWRMIDKCIKKLYYYILQDRNKLWNDKFNKLKNYYKFYNYKPFVIFSLWTRNMWKFFVFIK